MRQSPLDHREFLVRIERLRLKLHNVLISLREMLPCTTGDHRKVGWVWKTISGILRSKMSTLPEKLGIKGSTSDVSTRSYPPWHRIAAR